MMLLVSFNTHIFSNLKLLFYSIHHSFFTVDQFCNFIQFRKCFCLFNYLSCYHYECSLLKIRRNKYDLPNDATKNIKVICKLVLSLILIPYNGKTNLCMVKLITKPIIVLVMLSKMLCFLLCFFIFLFLSFKSDLLFSYSLLESFGLD